MPRNRKQFENEMKSLFESSYKHAYMQTFKTKLNDDETLESAAEKMAHHFSKELSSKLFPKFTSIIDDYIDSQEFDVTKLTAGGSPVSGILKSI